MKEKFDIQGMSCSACSSHVDNAVRKIEGVCSVEVNLLTNSMNVEYDENKINTDIIIEAVKNSGYNANIANQDIATPKQTPQNTIDNTKHRIIYSFIFLLLLMYVSMSHMFDYPQLAIFKEDRFVLINGLTQLLLTLPIMYFNRSYFINGFKMLFKKHPNMDTLIAVGSLAAFIYSTFVLYNLAYGFALNDMNIIHTYHHDFYYESCGMILTLITLGKYLETRSKRKTTSAIEKLLDLSVKQATIIKGNQEIIVDASSLQIGDTIVVKPGESIPTDGIIIEGNTSVDESMLTGESIPVDKTVNDTVISATINKQGRIIYRATHVGNDTTLAKIITLVEEASSSKAPIANLADKIASIFVPTVMIISLITFIIWLSLGFSLSFSLSMAIAVLVISCPCALGLATPVAIMVATGKAAQYGILIKNATALQNVSKIQTVVLDKTGTITEGKPTITNIITNDICENELLSIASSLEKASEHPLAKAFNEYNDKTIIKPIKNFEALAGMGLKGQIDDVEYYLGNMRLIDSLSINNPYISMIDKLSKEGKTTMILATNDKVLGLIALQDKIKPSSYKAIEKLHNMNIKVVMLTGDNKKSAHAIASKLHIDEVIGEALPTDKENKIKELIANNNYVAMVGDGINDAIALSRADISFAIGAGCDIAIESADIVLMKNDLNDVITAIELSKKTLLNIKENLFWAFFYNIIGIPLAAGLLYPAFAIKLNPMFGAAAMSLSSVCVVSNALRLQFFKASNKPIKTIKKTVIVPDMMCKHCVATITEALNTIKQIIAVNINLDTKEVHLELIEDIDDDIIIKKITENGYEVTTITNEK